MAAREDVDGLAVAESQGRDAVRDVVGRLDRGIGDQRRDVELPRQMPGADQDDAIANPGEVGSLDHVGRAGDGHDHISSGEGVVPVGHVEAVEERSHPEHRLRLDHRHHAVEAPEVRGDPTTHGAVAEDGDSAAVGDPVGDPDERLHRPGADGVGVLGELLDRAVVDDQERHVELVAHRQEPIPAGRRLLRSAAESLPRVLQVSREQVAPVVEEQVGPGREDAAQEAIVLDWVGGRAADDLDAALAQVVDGLLLRGVEVAGRHDRGAASLERQQERRGLRLEVDPGPDPQPLEGAGPLELVARLLQQPGTAGHPLEPRHRHLLLPHRGRRSIVLPA